MFNKGGETVKKETSNIKSSSVFSVFQKKTYELTFAESCIVITSIIIAVFLVVAIILELTATPIKNISDISERAEKKQYESVAKEIGVNEKEIIISEEFFKPGTYTAKTPQGTYTVQFDKDYKVKRIVKEE